jgi:2-methylcitrate dehydratase PrpD
MGSRPVNVRLQLRDGRVLEQQVDISKGNPEVPMTPRELHVKFEDCARIVLDSAAIQAASEQLRSIDTLRSIAEVTRHLIGSMRAAAA